MYNTENKPTIAQGLEAIKEKRAELDHYIKTFGEGALKDEWKSAFDANQNLVAFAFTAYTPYFMDGDECVYGINDIFYITSDDEDWYDLLIDGSLYDWPNTAGAHQYVEDPTQDMITKKQYNYETKQYEDVMAYPLVPVPLVGVHDTMDHLASSIYENSDIIKYVFGDHQKILVTRDEIQASWYDHD